MQLRPIAFIVASMVGSAAFAGCGDDEHSGDGHDHGGTSSGGSGTGGSTTGGSSTGGSTSGGSSGRGGSATGGSSGTSGSAGESGEGGEGGFGDPGTGGGAGSPGGEGGGAGAPDSMLCAELGSLCHPYDLGPGLPHDCHELGHGGDEEVCLAQEAACRAACSATATLPFIAQFGAKVGMEPFDCASTYVSIGADDSTIRPVDFKFYVHDVRLIDDAGMEVPVTLTEDGAWQHSGVALLDFENGSGSCSNGTAATNDRIVGTVPGGIYRGIAFKLGVPFELNHTDIATAPSPLNLSSMFWSWNMGRIFLSLMNSADTTTTPFETVLHVGSTGCMGDAQAGGVTSCAKPNRPEYRFPDYRLGRSVAVADVKEVLANSNLQEDLCHSSQADTCSWPFDHLGINWFTGSLTPSTQRIFRIE